MAEGRMLAPARWSRYVTRRLSCPEVSDTEAFLAWLLELGAAMPGHVLLPTSDDLAWLIAENREALGVNFRILPTPLAAVDALLDKHALLGHCRAVGIGVPETWFPESADEAVSLGARAGFPLVLKPRSQVFFRSQSKGSLVRDEGALRSRFEAFVAHDSYGERLRRRSPDVVWPMLQRYYPNAKESIYSLSGYVDRRGELVALRASRKILQRPRNLGIGLCFEEAAVDEPLAEKLGALCRRVGYQGVFEVEFIHVASEPVLIDFNPRFYGEIGFDVDRGLPLPRLAYTDALGDEAGLASLSAAARAWRGPEPRVYCHRFLFELLLRGQRLSNRISETEELRWREWWKDHRANATDAVADADDLAPWLVDVVSHVASCARHPRSFVRSMVFDG
jgi:predicted ATP-grasp superfamily ATP-dependent carboligase